MSSITLLSPAKINLILEVIGKRPDGYHEIRSIAQPINLFDEVKIELEEGSGIRVESIGFKVPEGKENLAWRAAEVFLEESGLNFNIKIFIKKRTPLGAGLGGGSSNAAAVLVGINRITKKFSEDELIKLSPQIGADVALFIHSRSVKIQGIGEKVTLIRDFPLFYYVLLNPGFEVSTKRIYELWDVREPFPVPDQVGEVGDQVQDRPQSDDETGKESLTEDNIENIISLFRKGEFPLRNDLEKAAITLYPEIKALKERLFSMGVEAVSMTGSGSTVFGVFRDEKEAKRVYDYLKDSSAFKIFFAQGISGWHRL